MKKIVLLFSAFIFSGVIYTIHAQTLTPMYNVSMAPISDGYYEYLPKGYSATGTSKYPLLLFFHGASERGNGDSAELPLVLTNGTANQIGIQHDFPDSFVVGGNTFEFIVLMPQVCCWPDAQPSDVYSMLNYSIQHYNVDTTRMYITGLSSGGYSIWEYAAYSKAYASRLAAIVPIAAADSPTIAKADTIALGNIAIWATHNLNDPDIPAAWTIGYVNDINAAPVPPTPLARMTIFNSSGHDAWDSTYDLTYNFTGTNPPLNVYQWMLQYQRSSDIILPLTGIVLNARNAGNKVLLTWETYTETTGPGFEIERSSDGTSFDSIGFVNNEGINSAGAGYSFTDASPLNGKNYYRLKQPGINNSATYSEVKMVDLNREAFIGIYPNPSTDIITVNSDHIFNNALLKIWNSNGQLAKQLTLNGSSAITVSVKDLPASGVYLAQIIESTGNTSLRFFKL